MEEFVVVVQLHASVHVENSFYRDSVVTVAIDGRQVGNQIVPGGGDFEIGSMTYREKGREVRANLMFSPLPTTADCSKATITGTRLEALGSIIVEIFPVRLGQVRAVARRGEYREDSRPFDDVVDEGAKKLGAGVGLGPARACGIGEEGLTFIQDVVWQNAEVPEYRFVFRYRTRAVLELTGVIQTAPTSSPSNLIDKKFAMSSELEEALNEESLEVLASEENSRLKRRLASMQQEMRQLRQRISNDRPKQVVDMTGDSEDEDEA